MSKNQKDQLETKANNESTASKPPVTYNGKTLGIAQAKSGRYHLVEIEFNVDTLEVGKATSVYSDMIEEDVKEKFQVESARLDFQWGF